MFHVEHWSEIVTFRTKPSGLFHVEHSSGSANCSTWNNFSNLEVLMLPRPGAAIPLQPGPRDIVTNRRDVVRCGNGAGSIGGWRRGSGRARAKACAWLVRTRRSGRDRPPRTQNGSAPPRQSVAGRRRNPGEEVLQRSNRSARRAPTASGATATLAATSACQSYHRFIWMLSGRDIRLELG